MNNLNPKLFSKEVEKSATRQGFGQGLVEAGQNDPRVVVLCADVSESTRAADFKKVFPERYVEVGVAEQNMASLAAGMAFYGKVPFISSYAVFSPGRNWEQIRTGIAYAQANVKIAGSHAGLTVGPDGATHQALEDIALMRVLPNMTVIVPCDANEARRATLAAAKIKGPVYLRLTREVTPVMTTDKTPFEIGKAYIVRSGKDATIIATGPLLYEALLAAECLAGNKLALARLLERYPVITKRISKSKLLGHSTEQSKRVTIWTPAKIKQMLHAPCSMLQVEVINCPTIKPLDAKTIIASAKKTGRVITVEEHQIHGGLFSAVAEALAVICHKSSVICTPIAMPDSFGESGEPLELLEKYGLTAPFIIQSIINCHPRA